MAGELPAGVISEQPTQMNPIQLLLQAAKAAAQARQGGGGDAGVPSGTPALPGGPPPNMAQPPKPASPAAVLPPNMTAGGGMALPAQAGMPRTSGPASFGMPTPGPQQTGYEFQSKAGRNAAIVTGAVSNIGDAIMRFKQKAFEKESGQARQVFANYVQMQQAAADLDAAGNKDAAQKIRQNAEAMLQDKKIVKLIEKAKTDPLSGAYYGMQQAYQDAQGKAEAQAKLEKEQQEANLRKQQAWREGPEGMAQEHKNRMEELEAGMGRVTTSRGPYYMATDPGIPGWNGAGWYTEGIDRTGRPVRVDKTGQPSSAVPTNEHKETTSPLGDTTVTNTTRTKGAPGGAQPGSVKPSAGAPSNTGAKQGSAPAPYGQSKEEMLVSQLALMQAAGYKINPKFTGSPAMMSKILAWQQKHGYQPGEEPSPQAKSRAAAAAPLIGWKGGNITGKGVIDDTIRDVKATSGKMSLEDRQVLADMARITQEVGQELGPDASMDDFMTRWKNKVQTRLGTASPLIQKIEGELTSAYSFAGSMHGWRALQVAMEFKKAFGDIITRPDSLIAGLQALKQTAELSLAAGDPSYRLKLMKEKGLGDATLKTEDVDLKKDQPSTGRPTVKFNPDGSMEIH